MGIDISAGGSSGRVETGSITLIDSSMTNVNVGILTAWSPTSNPDTAGSMVLENIQLTNVPTAIRGPNGATLLAGTTTAMTIAAWANGHVYTGSGGGNPGETSSTITPNSRPASLLSNGKFYTRSKPQYENRPASDFVSVRNAGAKGDAASDDTAILQSVIDSATAAGKIVFLDHGMYKVTSTLRIPPGAKIVGESFPTIISAGSFFNDMNNPRPVLQVGQSSGQTGQVELSDFIVSTQNAQAGAVLIQWNLMTPGGQTPSGMWDVHARIGGFTGSQQQVAQCLKTPGDSTVKRECIVAFMAMHVTKGAGGLYMENVWLW